MSCANLKGSWAIKTTRHSDGSEIVYEFMLGAANNGKFTGVVSRPPDGTINGVCLAGMGTSPTVIRFVLTIPGDRSIRLIGVVKEAARGLLEFDNGTYDNLLDPGDTGTGGGNQTTRLAATERDTIEEQAK